MESQQSWEESFIRDLIKQIQASEKIKWRIPYLSNIPAQSTGKSLMETAERLQLLEKLISDGGPLYPPQKLPLGHDYNWPESNGEARYLTYKNGLYTFFFEDRGMIPGKSFSDIRAAATHLLEGILGDLRLQAKWFGSGSKKEN